MRKTTFTCVVIAFIGFVASSALADWADLSGQFVYGPPGTELPKTIPIKPNKEVEVCGKATLFDESLTINPKNRGLANVVLWAYKPKSVHQDVVKALPAKVSVANQSCRFEPHVVTVSTSQTLEITNPDPVAHNAMMLFFKNGERNPLIPPGGKIDLRLQKSEFLPVSISCSIHPWMLGKILVQDHPYMAVTDEDGKFKFDKLPTGEKLTLKVWHEKVGYIRSVQIDNEPATWNKGKYQLTLKPGKNEQHVYQVDPTLFAKK